MTSPRAAKKGKMLWLDPAGTGPNGPAICRRRWFDWNLIMGSYGMFMSARY